MQINQISFLEDEKIKIARGQIKGVIPVHKLGDVPAMSVSNTGTIWNKNDTVYPWDVFANTSILSVSSGSASDVNKVVVLVGLDENFDIQTEAVPLATQTGNLSTKIFSRIHLAYMDNGFNNVGLISVKHGTTDVMLIAATNGQSLASVYTIPRNYTGYLYQGTCSVQYGGDGTGNMFVRVGGHSAFQLAHSFEVSGAGGQYNYNFSFPPEIPEKSDIDVRVTNRTNNARYTAAYDLLLIKNPNTE